MTPTPQQALISYIFLWASLGVQELRIRLQCRRPRFHLWVGKNPRKMEWSPTPVFLPGKSHGKKSVEAYRPQVTKSGTRLSVQYFLWFSLSSRVTLGPTTKSSGLAGGLWGHKATLPTAVSSCFSSCSTDNSAGNLTLRPKPERKTTGSFAHPYLDRC